MLPFIAVLPSISWAQSPDEVKVKLALASALQKHRVSSAAPSKAKTAPSCNCPFCGCACTCTATGCSCPNCGTSVVKGKGVKGCACGANCTCTAGECGDPNCPTYQVYARSNYLAPGPGEQLLYDIAYSRAVKNSEPLLVWVGETCPSCQRQWTEYVHANLSEFDSNTGVYNGPGVKVCRPDGLGGMSVVATLDGIPTKTAVQTALQGVQQAQQVTQPACQPIFRPIPMMMPMMGGCMGGFCGGGGGGGC